MIVGVVGGGPAGMMAAARAGQGGHTVTLFEKNEKLGKKLYITGKGRCNVTNSADRDGFFARVLHNPRFLYSAFSRFDNRDLMALIEANGVPLKTERGGRVFPASDKSSDILRAMERYVESGGVTVRLRTAVAGVETGAAGVTGLRLADGSLFPCEAVVLATGGVSYPQTGSTGDGYRFARSLGHSVEAPVPSLVGLTTEEAWPGRLAGLTLKNVTLTARVSGRKVFSELGEMLFTHTGVSGPLVLSLSGVIAGRPAGTALSIDLKPGLSPEQLDARLLRDLGQSGRSRVGTALHALLPARLLTEILALSGVDPALPAGTLTKAGRRRLCDVLQHVPLTVTGTGPMEEAIVTRGGISVSEVNASTMGSRRVPGLYFAGEVLDVDAATGGYNLQIAWSTGALAGELL